MDVYILVVCLNEVKYAAGVWSTDVLHYPPNETRRITFYGGVNGDRLRYILLMTSFPIGIVDPQDRNVVPNNI